MKSSPTTCFLAFLAVIFSLSCGKAEIRSDKRYTGRVVAGDCPSYAVVVVDNAKIGGEWRFSGTVYKNVIGISNIPDEIRKDDRISFNIDISTNWLDCQAARFCLQIVTFEHPKDNYCANDVRKID